MATDCLVLFLEDSSGYIDLFIIYDNLKKSFFLCGKKRTTDNAESFSFYCKRSRHLRQFAHLLLDDRVNLHIYNFNSLPANCDDMTFDLLNDMRTELSRIIVYYEDRDYYENLIKHMNMIKNIKNEYIEI